MKKVVLVVTLLLFAYGTTFVHATYNDNTVELARYENGYSGRVTPASTDDQVRARIYNNENYDGEAYAEAYYINNNGINYQYCDVVEWLEVAGDYAECTASGSTINDNQAETRAQYNEIGGTTSLSSTISIETY